MKAATILLLAVTVFSGLVQQSSAAPNLGGGINSLLGFTGKVVGSTIEGAGQITGKVINDVLGVLGGLLKPIIEGSVKDMKNIESMMEEMKEELGTLKGEGKEEVEAAMAEVQYQCKELEAFLTSTLEKLINGKITAETLKKMKALLAEVEEKLIAALKKLKACLLKVEADVSAVISKLISIIVKVVKGIESIVSKINKLLEAFVDKVQRKVENTNDNFLSLIVKIIENCNAYMAKMDKVLKDASAKAKDEGEKVYIEKFIEILASIKIVIDPVHVDMIEVAMSGDKKRMPEVISSIEKAIASVKKVLAGQVYAKLSTDLQLTVTACLEEMITGGITTIAIMKEISSQ